ncbi:hypothetical protein HV346_07195 [Enterobacter sp. RHBSTW-00994]|uniref:hypothetical protein n=1 Tax=Enterobacteriaceae TaxID=543 RepID=UPI0015EADABC|nr:MULTISPECIES: hypothetical protein [Enterobacteriaceae]MBM3073623.1 hypothetical protein [Lelliottia sp. RWM.1]QLR42471.1 hypothetical protein HV346_07195 [Enterobacter sp. RHBSTW-00994]
MSTICLAAQRSHTTGEAVWFSYRLPSLKKIVITALLWMLGFCTLLIAGLYAHVYWNLRHPVPAPVKAHAVKSETQLSDMHYIYVSKPFPHPQPKPDVVQHDIPTMQDMPINSDDADWQQAPEGNNNEDTSRDTLPGTQSHARASVSENNSDISLKALLNQAVKEQQQDYSQGKIPAPPVDETQDNIQMKTDHQAVNRSP